MIDAVLLKIKNQTCLLKLHQRPVNFIFQNQNIGISLTTGAARRKKKSSAHLKMSGLKNCLSPWPFSKQGYNVMYILIFCLELDRRRWAHIFPKGILLFEHSLNWNLNLAYWVHFSCYQLLGHLYIQCCGFLGKKTILLIHFLWTSYHLDIIWLLNLKKKRLHKYACQMGKNEKIHFLKDSLMLIFCFNINKNYKNYIFSFRLKRKCGIKQRLR